MRATICEIVISPMPPVSHVGLAVWPRKQAQWFELGLKVHPHIRASIISNESTESGSRLDLLVIDGDNPGPNFIAHYHSYTRSFGLCDLLVLGQPGCPALMTIEWEPQRTLFIAKPYLIEDVLKTILKRLESAAAAAVPEPPAVARREDVPPVPVVEAPRSKSLGYLSTLKLADLVQMLCMSSWTGRIDIQNLGTGETGSVHIRDGVVVDAQQDGLIAEPACYRMLTWGRCQFEFTEEAAPVSQTVRAHWQAILLEGARLFDEGAIL